jgi:hypothetical protein
MESTRKMAAIVGVLFIIATAFLFVGQAVYGPVLGSPDYLEIAFPQRTIAIIGILLEFACVLAIPLIPVFLFPVLKKHNEALALGYVGFRLFEAVLFLNIEINKLSLISLSERHLREGGLGASFFQYMGGIVQAENAWRFSMYVIIFAIGALMLYSVLYKSKLVPRFLSAWGFIAAAVLLTGTVLEMVGLFSAMSQAGLELMIASPIALNEMVLAFWLIFKGFNPSATAGKSGK